MRTAAVTICPASYKVLPDFAPTPPLFVPISHFLQSAITNQPSPSPDILQYPFGRPDTSVPLSLRIPKKVTNIKHPSDEWALTDCDVQLLAGLGVTSATYMNHIAKEPVHGSKRPALRNYMYFDWSVRAPKTPF